MANGSEKNFYRQKNLIVQPSINRNNRPSIDTHQPETNARAEDDKDYYHSPDEFSILRVIACRASAIDGHLLRVSERDIAELLAMTNGSVNLRASIDRTHPPSIDDVCKLGTRAFDQEGRRIFHWE